MPERLNYRFYYSCTAEIFGSYVLLTEKKKKRNRNQTQTREALGDLPLAKTGRFVYDLRCLLALSGETKGFPKYVYIFSWICFKDKV